jgi:nitrogen fixation protein FixH
VKTKTRVYETAFAIGVSALVTLAMAPVAAQSDARRTVHGKFDIVLIQPVAVTTGDNRFEVAIEDADGNPINGIDVTVSFLKSAWPIKRIPESRNNLTLRSAGDGRYRATWNVAQPGPWVVTVSVKNGETTIAGKKFVLIAY